MDAARYLPFAGRLLIALTFAMSGLSKLGDYSGTVDLIASSKLPLPAALAYAGAVAVEIICSVMLIVGFRTRAAALILALYSVATAVFFHQLRRSEQHHSLHEERGDDRRLAPGRRFWCGRLQHRQPRPGSGTAARRNKPPLKGCVMAAAVTASETQTRHQAKLKRAYDCIVIGSGASGAIIAGELSRTGAEVLVVESGGEDAGPTVQRA